MFAIRCPYPYCQHENKPGARFCGDCGAPLHLKPCPKCGKVDDVTAKTCSSCDAPFPPIELAEYGVPDLPKTEPKAPRPVEVSPPVAAVRAETVAAPEVKPASQIKALPLIVIAIFAGGLPLLWMNKSLLPVPAGQGQAPNIAPAPRPAVIAPAPVSPAPVVAPPAAPTVAPAVEPTPPLKPDPVVPVVNSAAETPAQPAKPKPKPKPRPAAEAPAPKQPCTDAVAALGLCKKEEVK